MEVIRVDNFGLFEFCVYCICLIKLWIWQIYNRTNIQKFSLEHFIKLMDVIWSWNQADLLHATTSQENKLYCFIFTFDHYYQLLKRFFYSEIDDIYTYIICFTVITLWGLELHWDWRPHLIITKIISPFLPTFLLKI